MKETEIGERLEEKNPKRKADRCWRKDYKEKVNTKNYKLNKIVPIKENILHRKQGLLDVNLQRLGN